MSFSLVSLIFLYLLSSGLSYWSPLEQYIPTVTLPDGSRREYDQPVSIFDIATDIGNEMYEKALKSEFEGVKVLELNGCISSYLWTKKPVHTREDAKGLKIRSPGGFQTNYIKSLGAEPIFMPLSDVYLSLETGTIDGVVTCPPLVLAF